MTSSHGASMVNSSLLCLGMVWERSRPVPHREKFCLCLTWSSCFLFCSESKEQNRTEQELDILVAGGRVCCRRGALWLDGHGELQMTTFAVL